MQPTSHGALCVAIHDVAPATWSECLQLLRVVREVADIPLSWLVVPHFHYSRLRSLACENMLERLLGEGHEMVLHGYTHHDGMPLKGDLYRRALRSLYTQREGEFAALDVDAARRRLDLGLAFFRERGWPVSGFVPPAWLLGPGLMPLLSEYAFRYTTTFSHFHLLQPAQALRAPALVYTARNAAGRLVSPPLLTVGAAMMARAPLVRVALHPRDARHPALMRHAQRLIRRLLGQREPMTKARFAQHLGA
ncbi:MAG: DUF2334 domain-containing protein [Massilia sp.]